MSVLQRLEAIRETLTLMQEACSSGVFSLKTLDIRRLHAIPLRLEDLARLDRQLRGL